MNLTKISTYTRRGVVAFIAVAFLYYLGLLFLFPVSVKLIQKYFPEKDPPTPVFGKLPALEFVKKKLKNDNNPVYKLDTKNGRLPGNFTKKVTVYQFKKPFPPFDKGKNAFKTAANFGFTEESLTTSLKDQVYKWRDDVSGSSLEINLDTSEFLMSSVLLGKIELFTRGMITKEVAIDNAKNFLNSINRLSDPLYAKGTQTAVLGKFVGSNIIKTENPKEAQISRVDFFRSINNRPIYGADPKNGLIYLYLRYPQNEKESPTLNFPIAEGHIWNIEPQSNATYPIITVAEAWDKIRNNLGVIVNVTPEDSANLTSYNPVKVENIFIDNIYLAYYDNVKLQPYLQPIYVFEGKYTTMGTKGGKVTVYYPAISPEYIKPVQ